MTLPSELQRIIIDSAFVMKKNEDSWLKIHNFIKSGLLRLKSTNYIFNDTFCYDKIVRIKQCYFYGKSPYVWLKKIKYTNTYYYIRNKTIYEDHNEYGYSHFTLS